MDVDPYALGADIRMVDCPKLGRACAGLWKRRFGVQRLSATPGSGWRVPAALTRSTSKHHRYSRSCDQHPVYDEFVKRRSIGGPQFQYTDRCPQPRQHRAPSGSGSMLIQLPQSCLAGAPTHAGMSDRHARVPSGLREIGRCGKSQQIGTEGQGTRPYN